MVRLIAIVSAIGMLSGCENPFEPARDCAGRWELEEHVASEGNIVVDWTRFRDNEQSVLYLDISDNVVVHYKECWEQVSPEILVALRDQGLFKCDRKNTWVEIDEFKKLNVFLQDGSEIYQWRFRPVKMIPAGYNIINSEDL